MKKYYLDYEKVKRFILSSVKNKETSQIGYTDMLYALFLNAEIQLSKKSIEQTSKILEDVYVHNQVPTKKEELDYLIENFICNNTIKGRRFFRYLGNKHLEKLGLVKNLEIKDGNLTFVDYEGKFREVDMITAKLPDTKKLFPNLTNMKKRERGCHENSIYLAHYLANDDTKVVTGWVSSVVENQPNLHTWVELTASETKQKVVFDFNCNAIFDRDHYYEMKDVELLSSVPREPLISLIKSKAFSEGGRLYGMGMKDFLIFADDIFKILEAEKAGEKIAEKE